MTMLYSLSNRKATKSKNVQMHDFGGKTSCKIMSQSKKIIMVVQYSLSIPHLFSCIEVKYDLYMFLLDCRRCFELAVLCFLHTDSGIFKSSGKAGEAVSYWDGISSVVVAWIEL